MQSSLVVTQNMICEILIGGLATLNILGEIRYVQY